MWYRPIFKSFAKTVPIISNPLTSIPLRNVVSVAALGPLLLNNYQIHNLVQMLVSRCT